MMHCTRCLFELLCCSSILLLAVFFFIALHAVQVFEFSQKGFEGLYQLHEAKIYAAF